MRHIKPYSQLFEASAELTAEQIDWLNRFTFGRWKLNPQTGLVDVKGNFGCTGKGLTNLRGIRFGEVSGYFNCDYNQLTTLEGAPQSVGGEFDCSNNQLTSLEGAPQTVGDSFFCYGNQLTTLKGAPRTVGGVFFCAGNRLTTLEGAPQTIRRDFSCSGNQLTSLEGAPQSVRGIFYCSDNPVSETTLKTIFLLMRNGKTYQQALEVYWPKMGDEDKALMYKQMPNLPLEDARTYKALATYAKIKGYL